MKIQFKKKPNPYDWQPFFAWRPIVFESRDAKYFIWLQKAERRKKPNTTGYEYRI
jgi:hypothetical protein